jgi:hypothetical protein
VKKSVVLLSPLKLTGLLLRLVDIIGTAYFDFGSAILEAACADVVNWCVLHCLLCDIFRQTSLIVFRPDPGIGVSLELVLLGHMLNVHISRPDEPQRLETMPNTENGKSMVL